MDKMIRIWQWRRMEAHGNQLFCNQLCMYICLGGDTSFIHTNHPFLFTTIAYVVSSTKLL